MRAPIPEWILGIPAETVPLDEPSAVGGGLALPRPADVLDERPAVGAPWAPGGRAGAPTTCRRAGRAACRRSAVGDGLAAHNPDRMACQ